MKISQYLPAFAPGHQPNGILVLLLLTLAFAACRGPVKTDQQKKLSTAAISVHAGNDHYLAVDKRQSMVKWKGAMQIGNNSHSGYVYFSKGELELKNGQLQGGSLEVDMNSIQDDNHKADNNLIKHLKDPDFFDVQKFPLASIVITEVADSTDRLYKNISANLTIKGISQPVRFPATVTFVDGQVKAIARLVIDRTKWDVRYKSGRFYDLLADQTMSDLIEFDIRIIAAPVS